MTAADPFDEAPDVLRSRRSSYKWRLHADDVLPAFVAEMDVRLAPAVQAALHRAVADSDTGYATPRSDLGSALADFVQRRYGVGIAPDDVHPVADVMSGVLETLRALTDPGDAVIVLPPVYAPFYLHIAEARCRAVEVPLARDGDRYAIDVDSLRGAFAAGAKVLLFCNPQNPTGRVFTPPELRAVAALAAEHDAWILSDEIHAPLVLPGFTHTPLVGVDGAAERTVTFMSASKGWNVPGLKCAQIITTSPRTREVVRRLPEAVVFRTGHLGVIAAIAAYSDRGTWLEDLVASLGRKHALVHALLEEQLPEVRLSPAQATYLGWLDCTGLGLGPDPAAALLEHGRVALDPGAKYGTGGEGRARATLATADATLHEIVSRMARVVTALRRARR